MGAIRLPDSLADLVGDSRFVALTFSDFESEKAFTFAGVGGDFPDDDWYLHGVGCEPSAGAPSNVQFEIKPGTRTAAGATLTAGIEPGGGETYRVGLTLKRAS